MTIDEVQQEIVEEFATFEEWMDKYSYIIELGNELPGIALQYKVDENLIRGCQSKVWLHQELSGGRIVFEADSDSLIVKGLIALLLRVYSGRTPKEVLDSKPHFIDSVGLTQHLSPTRSNGLLSMVKQMKLYALAYSKIAGKGNG